jgi:hypothetical protein
MRLLSPCQLCFEPTRPTGTCSRCGHVQDNCGVVFVAAEEVIYSLVHVSGRIVGGDEETVRKASEVRLGNPPP